MSGALAEAVARALDDSGPLAAALPGYRQRAEQQAMARAVAQNLESGGTLVVEAGTGVGKTFAYLLPAMLSGRKVVVSTGSRTLQDQLYHRDLPAVAQALGLSLRRALLKGRANYACLHRIELAEQEGRFSSPQQSHRFQELAQWSRRTSSGDFAEAPLVPEGPLLGQVSSTADNCLGAECPVFSECFVMAARRRAQEADLVVINHHLLLADWALREDGHGEVLPEADAWVLDEAHQLPAVASQFFGASLSSRQLLELARDAQLEQRRSAPDAADVAAAAAHLERATRELRLALGEGGGQRAAWPVGAARPPALARALEDLLQALAELARQLEPQAPRSRGLESCQRRCAELSALLGRFAEPEVGDEQIAWYETSRLGFVLRFTPLEVAQGFQAALQRQGGSWVFTSATLSVAGSFRHFTERLGLAEPGELRLESPFDYRRNALLLVPDGLPAANEPGYLPRFLEQARRVLHASRGRAFLLFTSHRALQEAARWLGRRLDFPLLVQGDEPQHRLLERFRAQGNAVLLGTQSFWEGVDVRGEALSCVMIDRLPFGSPGDPVTAARIAAMRRRGEDPFTAFQVPQAVISLRQGVGRLIRDADDRGVLVIGDHRLLSRGYGRAFLESLPPMTLTRDVAAVEAFFGTAREGA